MGASVVGGGLQAIAASQEQQAMMHAFQDEINRQQGFTRQAWGSFRPSLDQMSEETAQKQLSQGAQEREAGYGSINKTPLRLGSSGFDPRDLLNLQMQGQSRAKVGAYSDWQLNQAIDRIRNRQALDKISSFARGEAGVFPYRMNQAQHSADELDFWGKTISSIGGGSPWQGGGSPPMGGVMAGGGGVGGMGGTGLDFGMGPISNSYLSGMQQPLFNTTQVPQNFGQYQLTF